MSPATWLCAYVPIIKEFRHCIVFISAILYVECVFTVIGRSVVNNCRQ